MAEYWEVIYKAVADFGDLMKKAAAAKAELAALNKATKDWSAAEVAASMKAAEARNKDIQALHTERLAYDTLAESAKKAAVWTDFGGRDSMPQHLADMQQELSWQTLINRQRWLGFTNPQAAYAWRQLELQQAYLMNRAKFGATSSGTGYTTPDQYLSYLQREYVAERDLSGVMKDRLPIYTDLGNAYLSYAKALKGQSGLTAGGLGEALPGVQAYNNALVGLPDTVTTVLNIDDSAAMGKLATYQALLKGIPQAESTTLTEDQVIKAAYAAGGVPLPSMLPKQDVEVEYTGPYQEQFNAILAEIGRLAAMRAEIPVHFNVDEASLAALKLPALGETVNLSEHVIPMVGGAGGAGGGPPPPAAAAAAGGEDPSRSAQSAAAALNGEGDAASRTAAQLALLKAAQDGDAESAAKWAYVLTALGQAQKDTGERAAALVPELDRASTSFRLAGNAIGFFQQHFVLFAGALGTIPLVGVVTGFHLALDSVVEVLALLVPALATAAAGLLGWGAAAAHSGQQVYNQMKNVLTVSNALNTTVAPLTGNFQNLVNAVRPQVFQLFGDALDLLNSKTGVFQQLIMKTGQVLDEFGARVVVDMQRGQGGLAKFFDTGERVLKGLGQLFVPLGQLFSNLIQATEKTHIAEDLLAIADALAKLLVIVTSIPTPLLALVLGLHGLGLWGGLATTALSKMVVTLVSALGAVGPLNGAMSALAAKLGATDDQLVKLATHAPAVKAVADVMEQNAGSIAQFSVAADKSGKSVGELAAETASGSALFAKYGAGLESAGQDAVNLAIAAGATEGQVAKVASGFSSATASGGLFAGMLAKVGGLAGLATVGLGILAAAAGIFAYKSLTARDASQQWVDSINKGLASQSLFTVIGKNMSDLAAVTSQLSNAQGLNAQATHELSGAQTELSTNLALALPRVSQVSKAYGTDMVGALELLNLAGVKTSDLFTRQGIVWATDLQMVKGLIDGYKAMGQQLGTVGADLNVLLVSESDQLKSMGKLNQAWDAFQKLVSAPTDTILTLASGMQTFATDAKAAGASMLGLSPPAVKLQQDFQTTYGNVQQLFDAFRNAQAVDGGTGNFTKFVKDAVAALIPLAGTNKAAAAEISQLAQEAGGPATTNLAALAHWAGAVRDPMLALYQATQQQTVASSNLSADAAKLTNTLQGDLNPALAKAAFDAEGGQKALSAFADDLLKLGPGSAATITAGHQVADMFLSIDKNSGQAKSQFTGWVESMGYSRDQANQLWSEVSKGAKPLSDMRTGLAQSATASDNLAKSGFFAQRGDTFRTNMRDMANWFTVTLPHAIGVAGSAFVTVGKDTGKFFTGLGHDTASFVGSVWSKAWQDLGAPVTRGIDAVKHIFTADFDAWWKTHGTAVEEIWNSVTSNLALAWSNFTGGLRRAWDTFTSWFRGSGDVTKFMAGSWDRFYAAAVAPALAKIETAWRILFGAMETIAKIGFDLIAATLKTAWDLAMSVVKTAWDAAMLVLKVAWDTLVAVINVAIDLMTGHYKTAWTDVTNWFKQVMNAVWAFLQQGFNNFSNFFHQMWNNALSFLRQSWNAFWSWFDTNIIHSGFGHFLTSTLPGWFTFVYDFFVNSWKKSWAQFNSIFIQPADHLFTSTFPGWLDNLGRFFSDLWKTVWGDFSRDIISPMGRWFSSSLPNAIRTGFRDSINWVIDNVINKVINFIDNDILKHLPGSLHISTIGNVATGGDVTAAASGGPFARMSGSVPGASAVDGTRIMAMGGEYMIRQPARMALESHFGRGFMNWLNQYDQHAGAGSRGTPASQQKRPGVNYASGGLVNPIGGGLKPERVDMGVDYGGSGELYALGSGTITNLWNSGWPGGTFLGLRLNPPYGSGYWYYAEDLIPLVSQGIHVGAPVHAGQHIATALGGPSGIEVGWAAPPGTGTTEAAATGQDKAGLAHGDPGAYPTAWGVAASNLIRSLGGPGGIISGPIQGGTGGIGGALSAIWQSVEGLLDSAGTGLGNLVKPLAGMVSGGAGELLKLARQGAASIFGAVWDHTVKPIVNLMPGDSIPGAISQGAAAEIRQAIVNFMKGQDSNAQSQASAAGTAGGNIGPVNGPADAGPGQAQNYALHRLGAFGWGSDQFKFMQELWTRESGWNRFARNPASGAYGIPQALPPTKLPPAGQAGGGSHASPQIDWGLGYVKGRYGTPQNAWAHELSFGWYPSGGAIGGWDGEVRPFGGTIDLAGGGALTDWSPLNTAIRAEMAAMDAIQAAHLPPGPIPTMPQRYAYTAWQEALWKQQLKTIGLGRVPAGAYDQLNTNAFTPSRQTAGQWSALTGDLGYLLKEVEGTGIAGGVNPPGTPADSGYAPWKYLHSKWQSLVDALRVAGTRAAAAQTQWGSQYSVVPVGPGSAGQTNTDSPEWDSASKAMLSAVRTEMDAMQVMQGAHLPKTGPSMNQRYDYTSWQEALWRQQTKTVGLGWTPPGSFQPISDRLGAPGTLTAGQFGTFLGNMAYLQREEEGPGAGGINPPGSRPNSGWPAWKYLHGDWLTLLNAMRNAQAKTQTAEKIWANLYGPHHLPLTPGPLGHPAPAPTYGLVNVMPEATMGGPRMPVFGGAGHPDMGFAAGGAMDAVAAIFSGGLNPGGIMLPVVARYGVPDSVLRQASGAQQPPRDYPRRVSEAAAASRQGAAINFESVTINNPLPQKASDSIAHATQRLAFLAGRN